MCRVRQLYRPAPGRRLVLYPFPAAVNALMYIDRRMRREGLDVELIRAAEGAPVRPAGWTRAGVAAARGPPAPRRDRPALGGEELAKPRVPAAPTRGCSSAWRWSGRAVDDLPLDGAARSPTAGAGRVGLVALAVGVAAGPGRRRAPARRRGPPALFAARPRASAAEHRGAAEAAARSERWATAVRERLRAVARELE